MFLEVIVMKLRIQIFIIAVLAMAMSAPVWALHTDGGCAGCHTMHNAGPNDVAYDAVEVPLWKGVLAPTSGFIPYSSPTLNAGDVGQPDGDSLMCLSCHDGTTQDTGDTNITGVDNLGRDLRDDHPISFVYSDTQPVDADLKDPTITSSTLGSTVSVDMLDGSSKIQCTTCHDVHEQHNLMALRVGNAQGQLCRLCHSK
jgi:predicted CXXCH cytochrome family protein